MRITRNACDRLDRGIRDRLEHIRGETHAMIDANDKTTGGGWGGGKRYMVADRWPR